MSRLSFAAFCIENYADHTRKAGNEVYRLFKKEGLLDLIRDDYGDLHGMSMEYMMQFCDEYLEGKAEG